MTLYITTKGPIPEGCDYITAGKVYKLIGAIGPYRHGGDFVDDKGNQQCAYLPNSTHLGGKPWILCDQHGNPVPAPWEKCVHTEHCCLKHGCKYGDDDCPVATGEKPQSFPCEACDLDKEEPGSINYRAHAEALAEALVKLKETCEYWIGAVDTRGMSKSEYNTWLALGHHSKSMEMTRQALAAYREQGGE